MGAVGAAKQAQDAAQATTTIEAAVSAGDAVQNKPAEAGYQEDVHDGAVGAALQLKDAAQVTNLIEAAQAAGDAVQIKGVAYLPANVVEGASQPVHVGVGAVGAALQA